MAPDEDHRLMGAALTLALRGVGSTGRNPAVGCVIVKQGRIVGRGWTQPGGRPHAEAMALTQAGAAAAGATVYVTLEPCAHVSPRGPACADLLVAARPARVVVALGDPDRRTNGEGIARLRMAGVEVDEGVCTEQATHIIAAFLTRQRLARPHVSLKLAFSADGRISRPPGADRWITGPVARAHGHLLRARSDMILVGRGTLEADTPSLDVRLPGLEGRSPVRALLSRAGGAPAGWRLLRAPEGILALDDIDSILLEGGASAAAAFLGAGLVDRLYLYRAPFDIGWGDDVAATLQLPPKGWVRTESRFLGDDRLDVYDARG